MLRVCAWAILVVKPSCWRLGKASNWRSPTVVSSGKVSEDKIWQSLRMKLPPICCMLSAPKLVIFGACWTTRSPVTPRTLGMLMCSVVSVATARLPVKVEQVERAAASPWFRIVAVPDTLHGATT